MTEFDNTPAPSQTGRAEGHVFHQHFSVSFDYPVYFTRGLFAPDNNLLLDVLERLGEKRVHRAAVFIDAGLAAAWPQLSAAVVEYFHARAGRAELALPPQLVRGGEDAKQSWDLVRSVMSSLGNAHLDRQSYVIAIGGGAVLDMVGFAASLVHRGLRLVRLPSTTLAQDDAGVGVKTGMNEHGAKNFVGTFAPPFAVLNDFDLLTTLSGRDWTAGLAEAFKVALIKDAALLEVLCAQAAALAARDAAAMEEIIRRTAILHLEHIRDGGDPFETGSARPLDFGHWAAHKIETMTAYAVGHGQAVAIGIAIDLHCAMSQGLITPAEFDRVLAAMIACGLPVWDACLARRTDQGELEILEGLRQFQEHLGGTLTITLPDGLGRKCEVHHMDAGRIENALAWLSRRDREITNDTNGSNGSKRKA
ncbi:MAG: 3-dehydroquinate synthase [Planctomycetaceae bacterium]|nr:3-dehydroquinate synthase [Planctomycetaceae bacterium]